MKDIVALASKTTVREGSVAVTSMTTEPGKPCLRMRSLLPVENEIRGRGANFFFGPSSHVS